MTEYSDEKFEASNTMEEQLLRQHGPLMTGPELWKALGFGSGAAFRKARSRGNIGLPVFSIPQRRGAYALTRDVAHWLTDLEREARTNEETEG